MKSSNSSFQNFGGELKGFLHEVYNSSDVIVIEDFI